MTAPTLSQGRDRRVTQAEPRCGAHGGYERHGFAFRSPDSRTGIERRVASYRVALQAFTLNELRLPWLPDLITALRRSPRADAVEREAAVALFDGERGAAEFHRVYQEEAYRQGDFRHPDSYDELSEATKEWDRALARHCVAALRALPSVSPARDEVPPGWKFIVKRWPAVKIDEAFGSGELPSAWAVTNEDASYLEAVVQSACAVDRCFSRPPTTNATSNQDLNAAVLAMRSAIDNLALRSRPLPPTRVTEPELAKAIDAALMDAVRQHGTDGVKYWVLDGTVVSRGEVAARTALALLGER